MHITQNGSRSYCRIKENIVALVALCIRFAISKSQLAIVSDENVGTEHIIMWTEKNFQSGNVLAVMNIDLLTIYS